VNLRVSTILRWVLIPSRAILGVVGLLYIAVCVYPMRELFDALLLFSANTASFQIGHTVTVLTVLLIPWVLCSALSGRTVSRAAGLPLLLVSPILLAACMVARSAWPRWIFVIVIPGLCLATAAFLGYQLASRLTVASQTSLRYSREFEAIAAGSAALIFSLHGIERYFWAGGVEAFAGNSQFETLATMPGLDVLDAALCWAIGAGQVSSPSIAGGCLVVAFLVALVWISNGKRSSAGGAGGAVGAGNKKRGSSAGGAASITQFCIFLLLLNLVGTVLPTGRDEAALIVGVVVALAGAMVVAVQGRPSAVEMLCQDPRYPRRTAFWGPGLWSLVRIMSPVAVLAAMLYGLGWWRGVYCAAAGLWAWGATSILCLGVAVIVRLPWYDYLAEGQDVDPGGARSQPEGSLSLEHVLACQTVAGFLLVGAGAAIMVVRQRAELGPNLWYGWLGLEVLLNCGVLWFGCVLPFWFIGAICRRDDRPFRGPRVSFFS